LLLPLLLPLLVEPALQPLWISRKRFLPVGWKSVDLTPGLVFAPPVRARWPARASPRLALYQPLAPLDITSSGSAQLLAVG
jgi:hypothetical protein